MRARELVAGALAAESNERTSLLSDLRKEAAAGGHGFYDYDVWECQRVAEGSATVALRVAAELGPSDPLRHAGHQDARRVGRVRRDHRDRRALRVRGRRVRAAGRARCAAWRWRASRAIAWIRCSARRTRVVAKPVFVWADSFWERNGQNGDIYMETGLIGGTWTQREGILSALVPPERFGPFLATPEEELESVLLEEMVGAFGEEARALQAFFLRRWGADPWTLGLHHRRGDRAT